MLHLNTHTQYKPTYTPSYSNNPIRVLNSVNNNTYFRLFRRHWTHTMSRSSEQHRIEPFHQRTYHFCFSAHHSSLLLFKQTWGNVQRHPMGEIKNNLIAQYSHWGMDRKLFNNPSSVSKNKEFCSCPLYSTQAHQTNTINFPPTYLE